MTNGTDIYTNTYLEDPSETAKPAAVDFNVKYLVEIVYPNERERDKNKGGSDTGYNRDNKKDGQKNTDKNNNKPSDNESRPDNSSDGEPLIIIDKPDNNKPDNNKGKMIEAVKRLQKAIVKTGDESSVEFYTTLFFISTCIFILLFFRKKKNHR